MIPENIDFRKTIITKYTTKKIGNKCLEHYKYYPQFKKYSNLAIIGTFDHLHIGHKVY